jgi:hypothetical protein
VIELLAQIARNSEKGGTTITLFVRGVVVTGTIIAREEYFSRVGDLWAGLMTEPYQEKAERFWRKLGEDPPEAQEEEGEASAEAFIHLEKAQVVTGGGLLPTDGSVWRGQICRIDGFFFGRLGIQ